MSNKASSRVDLLLSDKGKRARYYRLTALGRKQLASQQSKWQAFSRAMGLILNPVHQEGQ